MQMLVYENYNKFISATETIQDMKTKIDGMESDMGRLTTAMSEITGASLSHNDLILHVLPQRPPAEARLQPTPLR